MIKLSKVSKWKYTMITWEDISNSKYPDKYNTIVQPDYSTMKDYKDK